MKTRTSVRVLNKMKMNGADLSATPGQSPVEVNLSKVKTKS